jgi:hypothetical protein
MSVLEPMENTLAIRELDLTMVGLNLGFGVLDIQIKRNFVPIVAVLRIRNRNYAEVPTA